MNEQLTTTLVALLAPYTTFTLPFIGLINIAPLLIAVGLFFLVLACSYVLKHILLRRLKVITAKTSFKTDAVLVQALDSIHTGVYVIIALYVSLQLFTLPSWLEITTTALFFLVITWQIINIVGQLIKYAVESQLKKDTDGTVDPNAATAAEMVTLIARITLWVLGSLFVLSNLGIEITSLIAGLGIGGVAIAFALQGILSDLFASFSIYFDKPFRIGDFIVVGTDSGTVEKIGIKSTRIRTLQGEELVVSNAELTTARVQNFKKMQHRRIVTNFGVTYDATPEQLIAVKKAVQDIFVSIPDARLDRIFFTTFSDFALQYELVYIVESSEYGEYLRIQEQFNLELIRAVKKLGVEFAFPTQTIYTKAS